MADDLPDGLTPDVVRRFVTSGLGLTFLPRFVVASELARGAVGIAELTDGLLTEALQQPVLGIIYDPANDVLTILLEGIDYLVFQPKEMYLDFSHGGGVSLGILDKANAWQIVLLRDPLMLPRAAALA